MSSVASLSIAFLRQHGKEASAPVIADAINCDAMTVSGALLHHVKSGGVLLRKEGRLNFYRLDLGYAPAKVNGSAKPDDEAPDHDEPQQRVVKAASAAPITKQAAASIFETASKSTATAAVPKASPAAPASTAHPSTWQRPASSAKTGKASNSKPVDLATVTIRSNAPIPKKHSPQGLGYRALVDRMKVGDSVELQRNQAAGLRHYGRTLGWRFAIRFIDAERCAIWLLKK